MRILSDCNLDRVFCHTRRASLLGQRILDVVRLGQEELELRLHRLDGLRREPAIGCRYLSQCTLGLGPALLPPASSSRHSERHASNGSPLTRAAPREAEPYRRVAAGRARLRGGARGIVGAAVCPTLRARDPIERRQFHQLRVRGRRRMRSWHLDSLGGVFLAPGSSAPDHCRPNAFRNPPDSRRSGDTERVKLSARRRRRDSRAVDPGG